MSAIDRVPANINPLSPTGFQFSLYRAPHLMWFLQEIQIPALDLPPFTTGSHMVDMPQPGEHLTFDELEIVFLIDENMQNYMEIWNWMVGLGFPEAYDQYKALDDKDQGNERGSGKLSDISVIITTNGKNPNIMLNFRDCHPINLSGFELTTSSEDVQYITCRATFKYLIFTVELLPA